MFTSPGTRAGRGESLGFYSKMLDRLFGKALGTMLVRGTTGWNKFLRGSDGQLIIADSTQPAGMRWGDQGSVTTGWSTVMDLDFSAQGSQTLSSNTAYTIGGFTFMKVNSASDATAMAVTNGSGLVIQPIQTTEWVGTTRTAPAIEITLSNLVANYDFTFGLRIYVEVASENPTANNASVFWGLDNLASPVLQMLYFRGFMDGAQEQATYTQTASVTGYSPVAITLGSGNRTVLFEIYGVTGNKTALNAAGGGAWPSPNAFNLGIEAVAGSSTYNVSTTAVVMSGLNLVIGARRSGSAAAYSVTVKRIRVDVRR